MPKVSVIIPVYKVEKNIEKCVRSLFEQSLDDIEYLFIDDCSPDNSIVILKKVLDEYPSRKNQVVIHRMPHNSGQAKVRNWGMMNAKGDFFIHCDSDDWVEYNMYEKLYNKAISTGADVVSCSYAVHDGNGIIRVEHEQIKGQKENIINDLMWQRVHWSLWNKLIKRELLNYPMALPSNNMGEDMVIVLQIMYYSHHMEHVEDVLYYYYQNPVSITHNSEANVWYNRFVQAKSNFDIIVSFYREKLDYYKYKESIEWLKVVVKQHIKVNDLKSFKLWITTFPMVEWTILFSKELKNKQRFYLVKSNLSRISTMFKNTIRKRP